MCMLALKKASKLNLRKIDQYVVIIKKRDRGGSTWLVGGVRY